MRRLGLLLEASPTGTVNCLKARQRSEVKKYLFSRAIIPVDEYSGDSALQLCYFFVMNS